VPGMEVTVTVPFTGDPALWQMKPNRWQTVFPRGTVRGSGEAGSLTITLTQPADQDPAHFKGRLDQELATIRFYLESQRAQIVEFNASIESAVRASVRARRARVEKHQGLEALLGIPLARREGVPGTTTVPMQRKLVRPLPPPPKSGYKPEPGIADADYDHILSVIRHEGRTFESTPATYAVHGEEDLRNIMLAHLNGHYQGDASGETFRSSGKTDIRIEVENRAAFVAECKVWKGSKELGKAVDQLLGYLTWRDCKTAIVLFNKHNSGFSSILGSIPEVLQAHEGYRKTLLAGADGEWQFSMTSREDEGRIVRVHVFAFDIYDGQAAQQARQPDKPRSES